MKINTKILVGIVVSTSVVLTVPSCTSDPLSPGIEYMPDMYRSPAVEAYVDYNNNTTLSARKPVAGTIVFKADAQKALIEMPYAYPKSDEGYEAAGLGLVSPLPTTKQYIEQGKAIYEKFCLHCHGEQGQGDGAVVTNGGYPPPPAYNGAQLKTLPEGKMFHTITYGKGQMGSHASQITKEERWKVIQYVKVLQNDGKSPFDEPAVEASADSTQSTTEPKI